MKKLAIIGASYLQEPLIQKAKSRGIETHVFAWKCGDIGEKSADFFYPISIVEKEEILTKCREIGIDGVCTISSDLAVITVNYVANEMGLTANSMDCTEVSTNKHSMRKCFEKNGDPSPKSIMVDSASDLLGINLEYPVIVKPLDRSGSRGITKVTGFEELPEAIERAKSQGFKKSVLVEEFARGQEYSVEFISWKGNHKFLALTKKYTTGAPMFIETGHLEPAPISGEMLEKVKCVISHALDSLGIQYGASHSELKISDDGKINLIEIAGRMGGDFIGSTLVELSTGYDFVGAVIDIALGIEPADVKKHGKNAGVRFVFDNSDVEVFDRLKTEHPEIVVDSDIHKISKDKVMDSSSRFGYFIMASENADLVNRYLPSVLKD